MASTKVEITYTWENDKSLKVTSQEDDGDKLTVVDIDENGYIGQIWGYVEGILGTHSTLLHKRIETEMSA